LGELAFRHFLVSIGKEPQRRKGEKRKVLVWRWRGTDWYLGEGLSRAKNSTLT
jgi:hypothetical protein